MSEPKPCPFCRGLLFGRRDNRNATRCRMCNAEGPSEFGGRSTWNTRPLELAARIEGLKEALEIVRKCQGPSRTALDIIAVIEELEKGGGT